MLEKNNTLNCKIFYSCINIDDIDVAIQLQSVAHSLFTLTCDTAGSVMLGTFASVATFDVRTTNILSTDIVNGCTLINVCDIERGDLIIIVLLTCPCGSEYVHKHHDKKQGTIYIDDPLIPKTMYCIIIL